MSVLLDAEEGNGDLTAAKATNPVTPNVGSPVSNGDGEALDPETKICQI